MQFNAPYQLQMLFSTEVGANIMYSEMVKIGQEATIAYFKALFQHPRVGTEESHEEPTSELSLFRPRFETAWTQKYNIKTVVVRCDELQWIG
jgi:hypothetical protein